MCDNEWIPVRREHVKNNLEGSWKAFLRSLLPAQGGFYVTNKVPKTPLILLVQRSLCLSLSRSPSLSRVCMSTNECESWWLSALWSLREQLLKMEWFFVCFQVDELYEAFCIQSRLREGAIRMKQAFSCSPSTKGTKESIAEVNRRYKEYTEVPAKLVIVTMKPLLKGCIRAMNEACCVAFHYPLTTGSHRR